MNKLILVSIFILAAFVAKAQSVGFVSRTTIYQSLPNFMKDLKMIDSLQIAYDNELKKESQALQEQARTMLISYNPKESETIKDIKKRMKPADTMALKRIFDKDASLDKKKAAYNTKLGNLQKEKISPILKHIDETIAVIAKAEQLDVVYFFEDVSQTIAYLNNERDYTTKVIAELKKK